MAMKIGSTSYPYRWISDYLGIPYWVVLAYRDETATGFAAREYVFSKHVNQIPQLREFITTAEGLRQ